MEAMQPFVDWKNMSGRKTTMVSVADAGGNNDNQIKSYIQNIYNDQSRNLQFVLFVGDYANITPHEVGSEYSNNWFGQLEGNDHYLEVFACLSPDSNLILSIGLVSINLSGTVS